jgi:hypothetical protein
LRKKLFSTKTMSKLPDLTVGSFLLVQELFKTKKTIKLH